MFKYFSNNILLAGLLIIFSTLTLFAQSSGKISGTIKDQNNAAILGASVTALNIASSQKLTVTTDASGKYEFTGLRDGSYRITASANGFADSAETIVLSGGAVESKDFELSLGGIKDVVSVTAGKGSDRLAAEIPQVITVASAEQIEQRVPRSTFEVMERAPNIGSIETNPARERPRLRGLSSNRLLVVIDGEKLNNPRTDVGASGQPIQVVDPSQLESVEVVAGSGSSLYGSDSIGGTINLITKRPTLSPDGLLFGLRLDGSYNSNGAVRRGNLTMNLSSNNIAFRASGNLYRNANYHSGNGEVTLAQNVAVGQFFRQFPTNDAGTTFQSAGSYTVFPIANHQEIGNGQGHGNGKQFDMWFFPTEKHSLRGKYLNRDDGNNGNAFSGPPYETQERYATYRSFDKFGIRYEGLNLNKYVARVSANYFHQKLSFPQTQYTFANTASAAGSYLNATTFTGLQSIFSLTSFVDNRNTINTDGIDFQTSLAPFTGLIVTVGGGRTKDVSQDYFFTSSATFSGSTRIFTGNPTIGASSPLTSYIDNNFYSQAEFDKVKWFRITAGIRFDKWKTLAIPGNGFPLSTEFVALNAATPQFIASPGALGQVVAALPTLVALAGGTGSSSSNRSSKTYNFGIVGRLPFGINPYFRWADSYREPGITDRYLLRNFTPGLPGLASLVVGNPNLSPETGKNYDVGVKVSQSRFNFSLGYFNNKISNLLVFSPAQTYCVDPAAGLPGSASGVFGCPAGTSRVAVQINARINQASATIKGFESTGEAAIPLGGMGSLNPFYSIGTLHGTNGSPTVQQLTQLRIIYNRTDTPFKLTGSATDFPLGNITPLRLLAGVQYIDSKGNISVEYTWRHQNRVTRADPAQFVGTALINYGSFASLNPIDKQSIKGGYNWKTEKYKFVINAGVDNIADKLFWEQFQNAPAPGRSFVFGFTIEAFNLLKK
jgi:outer membrane receptor protein involved in Fe transport